MTPTFLCLTGHDLLVARDSRPFGQGLRMRGLPWLLPSVLAGSFRTALVKSLSRWDFSPPVAARLLQLSSAGPFPVCENQLYFPSPNDCVWGGTGSKGDQIHRVQPVPLEDGEGVDFAEEACGLCPVRLTKAQAGEDFKPEPLPAWWPLDKYIEWLVSPAQSYPGTWFDRRFLATALQEQRDHVCLDSRSGTAAEGFIFTTSGLNVNYLPRFTARGTEGSLEERYAQIFLSARVQGPEKETELRPSSTLRTWHPLGGERRLVHWRTDPQPPEGWIAPLKVRENLANGRRIRMVLATPAIFASGWKPGWLDNELTGSPPGSRTKLRLVGVSINRWRAVSGWSMQPLPHTNAPGPKPIRRMVPAGGVYFFELVDGDTEHLASSLWLQPVSDDEQERRDGFGLALWGTW